MTEGTKPTGFQYTVTIDQAAAELAGLPPDIDDRHLAIVSMAEKYIGWSGAKLMQHEGRLYFLLDWQMVRDRLVRFPLNSRSRIKAAIQRLAEVGVLVPHPHNMAMRQSYFAFGETYEKMANMQASQIWDGTQENPADRPKSGTQASQIWDDDRPKSGTHTVPNLGRTMSIIFELIFEGGEAAATDRAKQTFGWLQRMHIDDLYRERVSMFSRTPPARFDELLIEFVKDKKSATEMNHRSESDIRRNFQYWAAKRAQFEQQSKTTGNEYLISEQTFNDVLADLVGKDS